MSETAGDEGLDALYQSALQVSGHAFGRSEPTQASDGEMTHLDGDDELGPEWNDVTSLIKECSAVMEVGEMIQSSRFSLFEAMSALEIMDPKMDAGMSAGEIKTVDESITCGELPMTLGAAEMIGVMDEMIACEMTWQAGNSLAQTLFTAMYLHRPLSIETVEFQAFCVTLLKSCDVVLSLVLAADVYEEEDFVTSTYAFSLCEDVTEDGMKQLCTQGETSILRQIHDAEHSDNAGSESRVELLRAVLARLRFQRLYYEVHVLMDRPELKCHGQALDLVEACLEQLGIIESTLQLGSRPPVGMNHKINRRLLAATPPRPLEIIDTNLAMQRMRKSLQQIGTVCTIGNTVHDLYSLLDFVMHFSAESPDCVPRCRLKLAMYSTAKLLARESVEDMCLRSMTSVHVHPQLIKSSECAALLKRAVKPVLQLLLVFCHNRARHRRKIDRILDDWALLQQEAQAVDDGWLHSRQEPGTKQQPPTGTFASAWVLDLVLTMMIHHSFIGFELDIYAPFEYTMMYWYLEYLVGLQINLKRSSLQHAQQLAAEKDAAENSSTNKKKDKKKKKVQPKHHIDTVELERIAWLEIEQALCRALFRFLGALNIQRLLPIDDFPYGSRELRFVHRLQPFLRLHQPSFLTWKAFQNCFDMCTHSAAEVHAAATEGFKSARSAIDAAKARLSSVAASADTLAELQRMTKCAIANLVAIQRLQNISPDQPDKPKLKFDITVHRNFCVISI